MKAFSLTLLTDHDSAQLNRKAIITPKAFSFHQKKDSPFPLNFVTWPQDDRCKLKKASALRPLGLLFHKEINDNIIGIMEAAWPSGYGAGFVIRRSRVQILLPATLQLRFLPCFWRLCVRMPSQLCQSL